MGDLDLVLADVLVLFGDLERVLEDAVLVLAIAPRLPRSVEDAVLVLEMGRFLPLCRPLVLTLD